MAILRKATQGALGSNLIQMTTNEQVCCGQTPEDAQCSYYLKLVDFGGEIATGIGLGGDTYWFKSPVILGTTQTALESLRNAIRDAVNEAGYTNNDIVVSSPQISDIEIFAGPSALAFNDLIIVSGNESFVEGCGDYEAEINITLSGSPYGGADVDLVLFDNENGAGTPLQRITNDSGSVIFTNLNPSTRYWVGVTLTEGQTTLVSVECADLPVLKEFTTNFVGQKTYTGDWALAATYPIVVVLVS